MKKISAPQAAKRLGISIDNLGMLEKQGLIHPVHNTKGASFYSPSEIAQIKSRRGFTLSEEAAQVGIEIQREVASSVTFTRKILMLAGGALLGYILLVVVFTALFVISPMQTAQFLGIAKPKTNVSLTQANQDERVLAAKTSVIQERDSLIQTVLQPIGKVSLGLVKNISPNAYAQVSKIAILDPNDVLGLNTSGAITPERPINLPESSLLQVGSSGLVANLNSEYLQGKQPGGNIGDIAVVGDNPSSTDTLADVTGRGGVSSVALTLSNIDNNITAGTLTATGGTINGVSIGDKTPGLGVFSTINGLTVTNNGSNTLSIAGGKTFTTNNSLTLAGTDGTTIAFQGSDTYVGRTTADILTNKTISGSTNTLSDIANSSLSNSSLTFTGNTGSGSVSLGGTLTILGSGINTAVYSGGTITITGTEADTLQSVYNRGNAIPTTTGSTPNTIDSATINVGNIAATAQQNFSTLNITNGGTGYLDIELIRGFINFQGMNTLYEDFTGKSLNTANQWTSTSTGGGSNCSILAGGPNGLFRMHSGGGANRGCELTTQAISSLTNGYYQRGNNPIFETKVKIDTVTNARIFAGFTDKRVAAASETNPSTNHAYIAKKAADTTWQCVTDDGGATETTTSTGVTITANTFYRLRVELRSGTIPQTICKVDDGTTVTRIVVTDTQPGITNPMDVYIKLNQSDTVAKNMDVDYVRAWQDDPPAFALTVDGNIVQMPVTIDTNNTSEVEVSLSTTPTLEETVASDSGSLATLVASSVNSFLKNLVEFFGDVIFHGNVTFLGRPTFNKDTAGFVVRSGDSEVEVKFDKEYASEPVVNVSLNIARAIDLNNLPNFAVVDVNTQGFKIKMSRSASQDIRFSWIAIAVSESNKFESSEEAISPTPVVIINPAVSPAETLTPTVMPTSTPIPTDIPISTEATQSASPSASTL